MVARRDCCMGSQLPQDHGGAPTGVSAQSRDVLMPQGVACKAAAAVGVSCVLRVVEYLYNTYMYCTRPRHRCLQRIAVVCCAVGCIRVDVEFLWLTFGGWLEHYSCRSTVVCCLQCPEAWPIGERPSTLVCCGCGCSRACVHMCQPQTCCASVCGEVTQQKASCFNDDHSMVFCE